MTTESAPRIKITYATLRADNEDLHAQFEAGLATVRAELGGHHRNYIGGAWRDGDGSFEVRTPIDTLDRGRHLRQGDRGQRRRGRGGRPGGPAGLGRDALAGARGDHQAGRRPHQRAADGQRRGDGDRGRQEPDRGARRGRGVGRPAALLRLDHGGQRRLRPPDGQPRRRHGPHPVDPAAARRLRGHQPVQLPDGPVRRAERRGAAGRQHGRVQALERRRRCRRSSWSRPTSTPACRPVRSTW